MLDLALGLIVIIIGSGITLLGICFLMMGYIILTK